MRRKSGFYQTITRMPVAASQQQKEAHVQAAAQHFRHLLQQPKPPGPAYPQAGAPITSASLITGGPHPQDSATASLGMVADMAGQLAANISVSSSVTVNDSAQNQYFSTHSPPILNLSPNLSPGDPNSHRASPGYDLRETTRRRSLQQQQGKQDFLLFQAQTRFGQIQGRKKPGLAILPSVKASNCLTSRQTTRISAYLI